MAIQYHRRQDSDCSRDCLIAPEAFAIRLNGGYDGNTFDFDAGGVRAFIFREDDHSQPATTARYAHLADHPVKAASDAVGRHIAAAMEGSTSGAIVRL